MLAKASVANTPTASAPMPTISAIRLNGGSLQDDNPVWAASVSAAQHSPTYPALARSVKDFRLGSYSSGWPAKNARTTATFSCIS
jgi:hypothetical protein